MSSRMMGFGEHARAALEAWLERRRAEVAAHPRLVALREARFRRGVVALRARVDAEWPGAEVATLEVLGESALLLGLSTGAGVVYRSRDLRLGAWFMDACRRLNDAGLSTPLHERRVVARAGYGWDDRVAPAPPSSAGRFFRAAGALLRVLQECRAVDMHRRNVVPEGDHLAVVDFEGLHARVAPHALSGSAAAVGLLPTWVIGEPGLAALDLGGLAWRPGGVVPLRRWRDGARVLLEETSPPAAPEDPWPHRDALLSGYDEADGLLRSDPALFAPPAPLPVRWFRRPAIAMQLLLEESLGREDREAWLAARVGGEELAALRDGELPLLTAPLVVERAVDRDPAVIVAALAVVSEPSAPPAPRPVSAAAVVDDVLAAGLERGVVWIPSAGVRTLDALPVDLLSGHAGFAVVLARLYAATGEARFADAARASLGRVLDAVTRRTARCPGAYLGLGGQLLALRVAGGLLDDRAAVALAAAAVPDERAFADAPDDVTFGVAGLDAPWVRARLAERRRGGRLCPPPLVGRAPGWLPSLHESVAWAVDGAALPVGELDVDEGDPVPPTLHPSALTGRLGVAYALLRAADPSLPSLRRLDDLRRGSRTAV